MCDGVGGVIVVRRPPLKETAGDLCVSPGGDGAERPLPPAAISGAGEREGMTGYTETGVSDAAAPRKEPGLADVTWCPALLVRGE